MRHCVALLLLLFAANLQKPQMLCQESGRQERATQGNAQDSQQEPTEAQIISSFLPETPIRDEKEDQSYNAANDSLYRWYLRATIAGVFVALGGLGILFGQSRHLQSQIRLQERALRQWINTSDWKAILSDSIHPKNGRRILTISYEISNVTKAPITIVLLRLKCEDRKDAGDGVEAFPENTLLLPNNPIRHRCSVLLTDVDLAVYISAGLVLKMSGDILYIDALQDTWIQRFSLTLMSSPTGSFHANYFHTISKVQRTPIVQAPPSRWRKALDWYSAKIEAMKNGENG
jgi:hypothetical protein